MPDAGNMRAKEIAALIASASQEELPELERRYADDPRRQVRDALARAHRRLDRDQAERDRVLGMYEAQRELGGDGIVVGVDEVGRGAVAGPLTVAAVALPYRPVVWGINDSKQLSPARREQLAAQIEEIAIATGIAHVPPEQIDSVGMAAALRLAMKEAIANTGVEPDSVLIDGNPVRVHPRETNVVKGDATIACIAAASIVAKVMRDALMVGYDAVYPQYHFAACKGYASADHVEAIRAHGLSEIHRVSFCGNFVETPRLF
ncbi:MAG: ribonuclease HII [Coriobacteriales bacterium]|nr:ribonuclease HII [Coriobacteriales bacterium]